MTQAYSVNHKDVILLVGEGNFSFTKDFLDLINKTLQNDCAGVELVTSCWENEFEKFSEFKKQNIKDLREKGVTVVFDVDATKLGSIPFLQNKKFTKVIFNFPHVGGKMKIHLNRSLLKDFFSSACDVLDSNGCIVVALCDGQGGTKADKKERRWEDTWQITEMAAQSDLILHQAEPFDIGCFPQYVNNGFRSCEKSFHCNNAVVHTFKKQNVPQILQDFPDQWLREGNFRVDHIFEFLDDRMINPFSNPQSATSYIYNIVTEKLGSNFYIHKTVLEHIENVNLNSKAELQPCTNNQKDAHQQSRGIATYQSLGLKDIYLSLNKNFAISNVITRLLVKKAFIKDFSIAPVKCQILVFGIESCESLFLEFLSQVLVLFNCEWQIDSKEIDKQYQSICIINKNEPYNSINIVDIILLDNGITCHMCHVDELAQVLFKMDDWRLLWNGNIESLQLGCPTFSPTSLFPRTYSFDLGLSLNFRDNFEEKLFLCLWLLAGDIITRVELLSTYLPPVRDLVCYCYRMTYKSFNAPLHRKRVIYIHEKIIAHILSKSLKINIT